MHFSNTFYKKFAEIYVNEAKSQMSISEKLRYFQYRRLNGFFPNKLIDSLGPMSQYAYKKSMFEKQTLQYEFASHDFNWAKDGSTLIDSSL